MSRCFLLRHHRMVRVHLARVPGGTLGQQFRSTVECNVNAHMVGPAGLDFVAMDPQEGELSRPWVYLKNVNTISLAIFTHMRMRMHMHTTDNRGAQEKMRTQSPPPCAPRHRAW